MNKSTVVFTNGAVSGYRLYIGGYIVTMTNGIVTAVKDDGSYVQVDDISVTGELSLYINQTANIAVTFNPNNATDKSLSFSSNNEAIATVDENGVVTAHAEGDAIITITSVDNRNVSKEVNVNVLIPVTGVDIIETDFELMVGQTKQLNWTVSPDNATDNTVILESGDTNYVTVSNTGLVTAVAPGTATITVSSNDDLISGHFCDMPVKTKQKMRKFSSDIY